MQRAGRQTRAGRPIGARFEIDLKGEQLWREGQAVSLRPKSWLVLRYLSERPGELVTFEELLDAAWPGTAVTPSALTNVINELRRALGDDSSAPSCIQTVFRRGYRWLPAPAVAVEPSREPDRESSDGREIFVGRNAELDRLAESWTSALRGQRATVLVGGDAGIGKTSLVAALLPSVDRSNGLVAQGASIESHGLLEPFLPFFTAIEELVSRERRWLLPLLERSAPSWLAQMPWLAGSGASRGTSTSAGGAASMLREGAALWDAIAAERPTLLVLEDLHLADEATIALIEFLANRSNSSRLLLVGTYRSAQAIAIEHPVASLVRRLRQSRRAVIVPLSPLSQNDIRAWLSCRFSNDDLAASLAPSMERLSEGNPLFLSAFTTHAIERGIVFEESGAWQVAALPGTALRELPVDLQSIVDAQLDVLGGDLTEALEVAAAAGLRFVAQDVASGMDRPPELADSLCHRLAQSRQFVRSLGEAVRPDGTRSGEYQFIHSLYRQACYQRLAPARRQLVHQRIALGIERAYGSESRRVAGQLATHFEAADDIARSVAYLREAVASAAHRQERAQVHARWEESRERLRLRPQSRERDIQEMQLLFARSSTAAIDFDHFGSEFLGICEESERLALRVDDKRLLFRARMGVAMGNFFAGRIEQAERTADQLLSMSESDLPTFRAHALSTVAQALIVKGDLEQAAAYLAEAVRLDPEPGIPVMLDMRSWAAMLYAYALSLLGRLREAETWAERAKAISDATGIQPSQATVESQAAEMYVARRDDVRAGEYIGRVEATQRQFLGEPMFRTRALASCVDGSVDSVPDLDAPETAAIRHWTMWPSLLASAQRKSGQAERALHTIDLAFRDAARTGAGFNLAELHRERGEIALAQPMIGGGIALAEAQFREAARIARHQKARLFELRATVSLARLLQRTGRAAEAIAPLREVAAMFEGETGCDVEEAREILASPRV
jgi:DNA-binding winged helix-turn-helix (wHTH) protein/tetratricopeptide (TPR) repeat protein